MLKNQLVQLTRLAENRLNHNSNNKRRDVIFAMRMELERKFQDANFSVYRSLGLQSDELFKIIRRITRSLEENKDALNSAPDTIKGTDVWINLLNYLKSAVQLSNQQVFERWKNLLSEGYLTQEQINLAASVKDIPQYNATVLKFMEKVKRYTVFQNSVPHSEEDIKKAADLKKEVIELYMRIGLEQIAGIGKFISSATKEGAPLDSVTPEVKKWMMDNNIADRFKIKWF